MKYPYVSGQTNEYYVLRALEVAGYSHTVGKITDVANDTFMLYKSKRTLTTLQVSSALQRLKKDNLVHQPGIKGYWQLTL